MRTKRLFFTMLFPLAVAVSCTYKEYGANPYDPDTPVTVSQYPKVLSFNPTEGQAGTEVTITGVNFDSAVDVAFGGKSAASFEIIDPETIKAVVSTYGATGAVSVTNHKGTRGLAGFRFIKPIPPQENANLALAGVATGTAAIAGNINNINDGDANSLWQAEASEDDWVMIDLGSVMSINRVVTFWDPMAPASEAELQVSTNGEDFTTVASWSEWKMDAWAGPSVDDDGRKQLDFPETKARFVKLAHLYNLSNPPYKMTLKEFEIYNYKETKPQNIALAGVATGTAAIAGNINNINDGDANSLWQAEASEDDWVMIDLGSVMSINRVVTFWDPMAPASEAELQVSTNGEDFTTVASWSEWKMDAWAGPSVDDEGIKQVDFETVSARYVKLAHLYNYSNPPYKLTLKEMEIYKALPAKNLALECVATGTEAIAGNINNVTDGDVNSLWQANASENDWIMVDLGKTTDFDRVVLTWDPMAPASEGELTISEDGETFETVTTWSGWVMEAWTSGPAVEDGGIKTMDFKPVKARYVRIEKLYNYSNPPYKMTLKEFEIYKMRQY